VSKAKKPPVNPKEKKTPGTIMAEKTRAKTNHLPDSERHRLMGKALELIYAGEKGKVCADRR
jgi:hypothetical protein